MEKKGVYTQIVELDKNSNEYIHNGLSPGLTYFYRIKAFNSYGDSNYSNEISAITNGIDYTIINSSFPTTGITNTIYNGSFIIKNTGIITGGKNVTWVIYRSLDTVINAGDIQIATGDISALDTGKETSAINFSNTWPMTTDTYYIIIEVSAADDGNINNNNVISESIYVASPFIDYKISNVSFPNTGVVNKTYNGNFTIRNLGNVAGSQDINWNVYLSDNSVYNAGVDTQIDAGTQVSISAGQTTSTISFNNIWTGSTGIYYLIILISETDDSDISNDIVVSSAIIVGTLPNSPNLISPSNGSYTKDNTPYFDWSSVSEAEEYNIQVDNNSSFSSPEIDQTISSSSYTPVSSLSDGTCYWRVKTKNSFGNWGNWSSTRNLIVDTQSPVQGNLSINNGAAYTNSTSVTLTLSASGASEVQFKKDSSSWSSWYSYSSSRSWTINSGDGSHYIYVKYKDLAGNESPIISDYIRLDTSAPSVPLGLSTETRGMKKIRLNWNSSSDSGIGMEGYKIYRDGSYIASTSSTTYTDSSGLYIEDSYSYRVLAYDDYGYESSKCTSAIGNTGVIKKYWASNDGYADEFNPSNIYDLTYLKTGPQGDAGYNMDFITCIKFDLSSLAGKTISSAYLNLVIDGDERERPTVYRLTTSSNWSESSLTWNSYLGMSWDTQYSNSNPSLVHSSASSPYERHQFNVEKIVELWVEDDETNNGFIVRCTANQGYTATYTSYYPRESYNTEQRPFLEIFYY